MRARKAGKHDAGCIYFLYTLFSEYSGNWKIFKFTSSAMEFTTVIKRSLACWLNWWKTVEKQGKQANRWKAETPAILSRFRAEVEDGEAGNGRDGRTIYIIIILDWTAGRFVFTFSRLLRYKCISVRTSEQFAALDSIVWCHLTEQWDPDLYGWSRQLKILPIC